MKAIKIIAGVVLLGVIALAWFALSESKRADYWANYRKTEPARNARHKKPDGSDEPEMIITPNPKEDEAGS